MILLRNVSYSYPSPAGRTGAVHNVSAEIQSGRITAVIGRTGSGKSTLMELLGGITEPDSGTIEFNGEPIKQHVKDIGLVFQYPEYQLFAETVYDDIAYGPKNLGLSGSVLEKCVYEAAAKTGLKKELLKMAPFELSGGQKRLAALAGILAMNPKILLLDEPAAGLDPSGRTHIFGVVRALLASVPDMTVIFVTHSMEDAAQYAEDIIVLDNGTIASHGTPADIFSDEPLLLSCGLDIPEMAKLGIELKKLGIETGGILTVEDAYNSIVRLLKGGHNGAS